MGDLVRCLICGYKCYRCLKENGVLVRKEVNLNDRKVMEASISGKRGGAILYAPKTIMLLF